MRRLPLAFLLVLLLPASTAAAADTLASPTPGSAYSGALAVDYSLDHAPQDDIRLVFTYKAGDRAPVGATFTVTLTGTATSGSFSMSTADPAGGSGGHVASMVAGNGASGPAIVEGEYDVQLRYTGVAPAQPYQSAVVAGVVIDRTTLAPSLIAPQRSSILGSPMEIRFSLPERALPGSVKLTFKGFEVEAALTLTAQNELIGLHELMLSSGDLRSSPDVAAVNGPNALPDRMYEVTLSYRDALGNPYNSDTSADVSLETAPMVPREEKPPDSGGTAPPPTRKLPDIAHPPTVPKRSPSGGNERGGTSKARGRLAVSWRVRRAATGSSRWTATAGFRTQKGAKSYSLTAVRGSKRARGKCRVRRRGASRSVRCTLTLRGAGRWKLTATATGAKKAVLARGGRTVTLRSSPRR